MGLALLCEIQSQIVGVECDQILQVVQRARKCIFGVRRREAREGTTEPRYSSSHSTGAHKNRALDDRSKSEPLLEDSSLEKGLAVYLEEQKRAILHNSRQFKVRYSELESLGTKFELKKMEVSC